MIDIEESGRVSINEFITSVVVVGGVKLIALTSILNIHTHTYERVCAYTQTRIQARTLNFQLKILIRKLSK